MANFELEDKTWTHGAEHVPQRNPAAEGDYSSQFEVATESYDVAHSSTLAEAGDDDACSRNTAAHFSSNELLNRACAL